MYTARPAPVLAHVLTGSTNTNIEHTPKVNIN